MTLARMGCVGPAQKCKGSSFTTAMLRNTPLTNVISIRFLESFLEAFFFWVVSPEVAGALFCECREVFF